MSYPKLLQDTIGVLGFITLSQIRESYRTYFSSQDSNNDMQVSLNELLVYNNSS